MMSGNILYIIGGVPRAGKSTLRKKILREDKISGFSTDIIRDILEKAYPEENDFKQEGDLERAKKFNKLWTELIDYMGNYLDDWVIEGVNFLPNLISDKKSENVKICFLAYPKIKPDSLFDRIRKYSSLDDDWTSEISDSELLSNCKEWINDSIYLEKECAKSGIQLFDTSHDYMKGVNDAYEYLLKK